MNARTKTEERERRMKKAFLLIMSVLVVFAFASCSGDNPAPNGGSGSVSGGGNPFGSAPQVNSKLDDFGTTDTERAYYVMAVNENLMAAINGNFEDEPVAGTYAEGTFVIDVSNSGYYEKLYGYEFQTGKKAWGTVSYVDRMDISIVVSEVVEGEARVFKFDMAIVNPVSPSIMLNGVPLDPGS